MVVLLSMRMYFLRKRAAWDRKEVPYVRGISPAFGVTTLLLAGTILATVALVPSHRLRPDCHETRLAGYEHPVEGDGNGARSSAVLPARPEAPTPSTSSAMPSPSGARATWAITW